MRNYDTDILIWSDREAELLRRAVVAGLVNEAPDWPNAAEEIESVGSGQRHADALRGLLGMIDDQAPLSVPAVCPITLEEMMSDEPAA